jgi:hypothetical protein
VIADLAARLLRQLVEEVAPFREILLLRVNQECVGEPLLISGLALAAALTVAWDSFIGYDSRFFELVL